MAIDRTGISSLDAGSLDITYSGDEGPKSPKQIAGGEYNRVIELLEIIREGGPLSEEEKIELQQLIKTLTAKGINVEQLMGESRNMRMASTDPILQDEYDKYVFELNEMHPEATPMSIEDFRQQATSGMAEGGIARLGYANGQLVQPGPGRPGYGGRPGGFEETAAAGKSYEAAKAADPQGGAANWQQQALQQHRTQQQARGEGEKQQKYEAEAKAYQEAEDARIKEEFIQKSKREQELSWLNKKRAESAKKSLKKLMLSKMRGGPFSFPSILGQFKGPMSDEEFEKEYGMSYEDFANINPMHMEAIFGSVKDKVSQAERDDIRRISGGLGSENLHKQSEWEKIFYGPKGPPQPGGGGGEGIMSQYPYPQDVHPGTDPTIDPVTDIPVDPIRFASNVPSEHDFSSQYFYGADGGDVRQRYGLGKLVKKATKAIGKIAKSPLGKAALMYGLGSIPFGAKGSLLKRMGTMFTGVPGVNNPGGDSMWSKMLGSMSSKPFP